MGILWQIYEAHNTEPLSSRVLWKAPSQPCALVIVNYLLSEPAEWAVASDQVELLSQAYLYSETEYLRNAMCGLTMKKQAHSYSSVLVSWRESHLQRGLLADHRVAGALKMTVNL